MNGDTIGMNQTRMAMRIFELLQRLIWEGPDQGGWKMHRILHKTL